MTLQLVAIDNAPYEIVAFADGNPEVEIPISDDSRAIPSAEDPKRGILFSQDSLTVKSNATATWNVSLTSAPTDDVTVRTYIDGLSGPIALGPARTVTPSELTFTSTNWRTPQQFTVDGSKLDAGRRHYIFHGLSAMTTATIRCNSLRVPA